MEHIGTGITTVFANFIESIGGGGNALLGFGSIITQVFGSVISREINNFISNIQAAKYNLEQLQNDIKLTESFGHLDLGSQKAVDQMVKLKKAAQDYYNVMSSSEINAYQGLVKNVGELRAQSEAYERLKNQAEAFNRVIDENQGFQIDKDVKFNLQELDQELQIVQESLTETFSAVKPDNLKESFDVISSNIKNLKSTLTDDVWNTLDSHGVLDELMKKTEWTSQEFQIAKRALQNLLNSARTGIGNTGAVQQLGQQARYTAEQADYAAKKARAFIEQVKQFSTVKSFVDLASSIGGIASSINSLVNLTKVWENENLSAGQKVLQTFTNLSFAVGMLHNGLQRFKTSFSNIINHFFAATAAAKAMGEAQLATALQTNTLTASFFKLGTVLKANPIILVISGIAAAIAASIALYDKFTMSAKQAAQAIEQFGQKQKEASSNIKNFNAGKNELQDIKEEYQQLAKKASAITFDSNIDNLTEKERARYNQLKELVGKYNTEVGYEDARFIFKCATYNEADKTCEAGSALMIVNDDITINLYTFASSNYDYSLRPNDYYIIVKDDYIITSMNKAGIEPGVMKVYNRKGKNIKDVKNFISGYLKDEHITNMQYPAYDQDKIALYQCDKNAVHQIGIDFTDNFKVLSDDIIPDVTCY